MKVETAIFLSAEILPVLDQLSGGPEHRSNLIEQILRDFIRQPPQDEPTDELNRINQQAEWLNQEALEVLDYQVKYT